MRPMVSKPQPLAISDDQMTIVLRGAEPLHPHDHGPYLEAVAELLRGREVGDGLVSRAVREAQGRYRQPPAEVDRHPTKYSRRG
jgi:hypothetical protein